MGRPLPGVELRVEDGGAGASRPRHRPDVLRRLPRRSSRRRRTCRGALGTESQQDEDGYLYFVGRADDVIISAGYRIGPFEVESALVSHAAVAEAAVVGGARRGAGSRRPRRRRPARRVRTQSRPRRRAPGARQARDRALQVPADRRVRRRAAEDGQRQGPPGGAAAGTLPLGRRRINSRSCRRLRHRSCSWWPRARPSRSSRSRRHLSRPPACPAFRACGGRRSGRRRCSCRPCSRRP